MEAWSWAFLALAVVAVALAVVAIAAIEPRVSDQDVIDKRFYLVNPKHVVLPPSWDIVDALFYINLDTAEDRRASFTKQLENVQFPPQLVKRVSGIVQRANGIGSMKSHINALKEALKDPHIDVFAVAEDDAIFNTGPNGENLLKEHLWLSCAALRQGAIPEDAVVLLAYNMNAVTNYRFRHDVMPYLFSGLQRAFYSKTKNGHGVVIAFYVMRRKGAESLVRIWEANLPNLEKTGQHWNFLADRCIDEHPQLFAVAPLAVAQLDFPGK